MFYFFGKILEILPKVNTKLRLLSLLVLALLQGLLLPAHADASKWYPMVIEDSFKITAEAKFLTTWKLGEGTVEYSFAKRKAVRANGDISFTVIRTQWKPTKVDFGISKCYLQDLGDQLVEPDLSNMPSRYSSQTHRLRMGHYYLMRVDDRVMLLLC